MEGLFHLLWSIYFVYSYKKMWNKGDVKLEHFDKNFV